MEQSQNRTMLIVLILALGLFFEVLNGIRRSESANSKREYAIGDATFSPYHVTSHQMLADSLAARARHLIGMRLQGLPTKFNFQKLPKNDVSLKKASGKIIAKKKVTKLKKKKTAARGKKPEIEPQYLNSQFANHLFKPLKNTSPQPTVGIITAAPKPKLNPGATGTTNNQTTYQEWVHLLLPSTSQAVVAKFVQYYQRGLVTLKVFYQLLSEMDSEPSSNEQLLAIYAANAAPSSESFLFLVNALKAAGNNTSVISTGYQYIDSYQSLSLVPILKQVFAQSIEDETVVQIAASVLNMSTSTYLGVRTPSSAASTVSSTDVVRAYAGFVPVIETVINVYSKNSALVGELQKSLNLIKNVEPSSAAS